MKERGQGLNSGVKDALELVKCIESFLGQDKQRSRQEAVNAYEAEMKDRTGTEVRLSRSNTELLHQWDRVLQSPLVSKGFSKTEIQK